jgi:putative ATPase
MSTPPLAERMRPKTLENYIGQSHLMSTDASFRKQIEGGKLHSMILWGPPGVGKTTLALLIARISERIHFEVSAINSGVKDLRDIIQQATNMDVAPILFIDEIHRFNKSQQDALLGAVERGNVILIGATTENPSFEVISALLSRTRVYVLNPLDVKDLKLMLSEAILKDSQLSQLNIELQETEALIKISGGDARKLFNGLEIVVHSIDKTSEKIITNEIVMKILQENLALYDKSGEMHYDIISAFIKSVRGSDADAAIYYLARMLEAGESIEFIGRRLVILAAEDIGLANPNALLLATQGFEAIRIIGMPEARIILSEVCIYLANSPKSNSAYLAIDKALQYVRQNPYDPVPLHLRNAPTGLMRQLDYGKKYLYPHDFPNNYIEQNYLPNKVKDQQFYSFGQNQAEIQTLERLKNLKSSINKK